MNFMMLIVIIHFSVCVSEVYSYEFVIFNINVPRACFIYLVRIYSAMSILKLYVFLFLPFSHFRINSTQISSLFSCRWFSLWLVFNFHRYYRIFYKNKLRKRYFIKFKDINIIKYFSFNTYAYSNGFYFFSNCYPIFEYLC